MSFAAEGWAWEQDCPSTAAKFVLVCLAWYANKEGERAFPSIPTICRRTNLNQKTVRKALRILCDVDLVERHTRPGDDASKPHLSAEYRLKIRDTPLPDLGGVSGASPLPKTEGEGVPKTEGGDTKSGTAPLPDLGGNLSIEPSKEVEDSNIHSLESYRARARPKAKRPAKTKTMIPDGWFPDDKGRTFAQDRNVPCDEVECFIAYHQSKATESADWSASWRTWCMNHTKYRQPNHRPVATNGSPFAFGRA